MSRFRAHDFRFDILEARELLAASHHVVASPHKSMVAAAPLVLDGMLAVDNKGMSSTPNAYGSTTISIPVVGNLTALGRVSGAWNQTEDSFGDSSGVNVLRLQTAKGSLVITFNTTNTAKPHPAGHGQIYYARAQKLLLGTGAYAHTKESGMVDMTTNSARSEIVSLTLKSAP